MNGILHNFQETESENHNFSVKFFEKADVYWEVIRVKKLELPSKESVYDLFEFYVVISDGRQNIMWPFGPTKCTEPISLQNHQRRDKMSIIIQASTRT